MEWSGGHRSIVTLWLMLLARALPCLFTLASPVPQSGLCCSSAPVQGCFCDIWLLRLNLGFERGFEAVEATCGLSSSWPISTQAEVSQSLLLPRCQDDVLLSATTCDDVVCCEQRSSAEGGLAQGFWALLDSCCMQLECLGRSLLLMYCLALGRMLFGLAPLRKGQSRRNVRIVRARRLFSGAPLCFIFGIAAWCLPSALAVKVDYGCTVPDNAGSSQRRLEGSVRQLDTQDAGHAAMHTCRDMRDTGQDDAVAQAYVYRFQATTKAAQGWIGPHEGVEFACKMFQDELFHEDEPLRLIPVHPQPSCDVVVLLDAPSYITNQLLVPVLFEVQGKQTVRFVDVLVGRVMEEDLRHAVGDLWIPGGQFFVSDSMVAVCEEDIVQLQPGVLIRPGWRCRSLSTLAEKLQRPKQFFRYPVEPFPLDLRPVLGFLGLIGQWGDWTALSTNDVVDTPALKTKISRVCGVPEGDFLAIAPADRPRELMFKGRHIPSVLAIIPKSLEGACILFVDARALGIPLRSLHVPPLYTSLGTVLRLAGGMRPIGLELEITGVQGFDKATETFMPTDSFVGRYSCGSRCCWPEWW